MSEAPVRSMQGGCGLNSHPLDVPWLIPQAALSGEAEQSSTDCLPCAASPCFACHQLAAGGLGWMEREPHGIPKQTEARRDGGSWVPALGPSLPELAVSDSSFPQLAAHGVLPLPAPRGCPSRCCHKRCCSLIIIPREEGSQEISTCQREKWAEPKAGGHEAKSSSLQSLLFI